MHIILSFKYKIIKLNHSILFLQMKVFLTAILKFWIMNIKTLSLSWHEQNVFSLKLNQNTQSGSKSELSIWFSCHMTTKWLHACPYTKLTLADKY